MPHGLIDTIICAILCSIFIAAYVSLVVLTIANHFCKNNQWFCRTLGWHNGDLKTIAHAGCKDEHRYKYARCSRCGAEVHIDRRGNWAAGPDDDGLGEILL